MPHYACKYIGCANLIGPDQDFCTECQQPTLFVTSHLDEHSKCTKESDPYGKDPHTPGAKVDTGKVRMHLITGGMARAITEVAKVGTFGAAKYTDGGWVQVPDGFRRYEDAQQRHAALRHMGEDLDQESRLYHLAHEAWNALAKLDLFLREKEPH